MNLPPILRQPSPPIILRYFCGTCGEDWPQVYQYENNRLVRIIVCCVHCTREMRTVGTDRLQAYLRKRYIDTGGKTPVEPVKTGRGKHKRGALSF